MEVVVNGKTVKANSEGDTWLSKWSKLPPEELKKVAPHLFEVEIMSEEMKLKDARIKELESLLIQSKPVKQEVKPEVKKESRSEVMKRIWAEKKAKTIATA